MSEYSLEDYLAMIADPVRTSAWVRGIRQVVRPGDHVLELGTGAGFFAVVAAQAGAAHVHAVEPNPAAALARELAAANGVSDRVTVHVMRAQDVQLPRRCDVLIEDIRSALPFSAGHFPAVRDAWQRLLTPQARVLAHEDVLWAIPVETQAGLPRTAKQGVSLEPLLRRVALQPYTARPRRDEALAEPATWGSIRYASDLSDDHQGTAAFEVTRDGVVGAIALWFECRVAPGVSFDTSPFGPVTVYPTLLLPVHPAPTVRRGDRLRVSLRVTMAEEAPVYRWAVSHRSPEGVWSPATSQHSLQGAVLPREALDRRAASHRPQLRPEAGALARALQRFAEGATLGQAAQSAAEELPTAFGSAHAAQRWLVSHLASLETPRDR